MDLIFLFRICLVYFIFCHFRFRCLSKNVSKRNSKQDFIDLKKKLLILLKIVLFDVFIHKYHFFLFDFIDCLYFLLRLSLYKIIYLIVILIFKIFLKHYCLVLISIQKLNISLSNSHLLFYKI